MPPKRDPSNDGPRGGKKAVPYWVNRYSPPKDISQREEPDRVRLLPAEFVNVKVEDSNLVEIVTPFFKYIEHFHGGIWKRVICSAGPWHFSRDTREPCLGCDIYWDDQYVNDKGEREAPINKRDMYAINVLVYGTFLQVEERDKDGAIKTNNSGKPYYKWEKAKKNDPRIGSYKQKEGHVMHWPMGITHWSVLMDQDQIIGKTCLSCGSRKSIESLAWVCARRDENGNPICQHPKIEMDSTTLSGEEIDQIVQEKSTCPACGYHDYLEEMIACSKCGDARRATLFDVDLDVQRNTSGEAQATILKIPEWYGPSAIPEELVQQAVPLPLNEIYAPTPIKIQQNMFGSVFTPSDKLRRPSNMYGA